MQGTFLDFTNVETDSKGDGVKTKLKFHDSPQLM